MAGNRSASLPVCYSSLAANSALKGEAMYFSRNASLSETSGEWCSNPKEGPLFGTCGMFQIADLFRIQTASESSRWKP
jgi:hypothetical protein